MKTSKAPLTPSWDLVIQSFNLLKQQYIPLMYLVLIPSLLTALGSLWLGPLDAEGRLTTSNMTGAGVVAMGFGLLWMIINIGPVTLFELRAAQNKPITLREAYAEGLKYNFKLYGYYILYALLLVAGLILLIIPGLIVLRRYLLSGFYIVDKNMSIWKAMQQSAAETKPLSGWVWGIIGVQFLVSIIASSLQNLGAFGIILGQVGVLAIIFLPALRYLEVRRASKSTKND